MLSAEAPCRAGQQKTAYWRKLSLLVLVLALVAVVWYWHHSVERHQHIMGLDFKRSAEHATNSFQDRLRLYETPIYAVQALVGSSHDVSGGQWREFIDELQVEHRFSGVSTIAYAEYRELNGHQALLSRLQDKDALALAEKPEDERGFSLKVKHLQHLDESSVLAAGFDFATEAPTLVAALEACCASRAMLSGVIVEPGSGRKLVRQVMPVFRLGMPVSSEEERRAALSGLVVISYDLAALLAAFADELERDSFFIRFSEAGDEAVYDSRPPGRVSSLSRSYPLTIGGRNWQLDLYSTPQFDARLDDLSLHLFPLAALLLLTLLWLLVQRLLSGQRRAEQLAMEMTGKLRHSEERYRAMFEGNRAVELLVDPQDGAIVDANQAAVNYYGYSRDELKAMNIAQINVLTPDEVRQEMSKAQEQRRNHFLFKHRHATGELRDVEVHSGPIEVGDKVLLYSIVHDVTARMESERALRESEARYHTIIDTAAEGYWLLDLASLRLIEVNAALCRMLGYSAEEMLGRQPFDFVDEENSKIFAYQATQVEECRQRHYEVVMRHKDGHDVVVRLHATNMPVSNGETPQQAFAFISDITEWRRNEEQLRIAATFFETTSEAITVTDANNRIVAINPAFSQITGYSEEETLGRDPGFLSAGRNDAAFYQDMWHTLQTVGRWQGEIWNRRKNGEIYPEWLSIVAIRDAQEVVRQYMAVFSDITKRKKDEAKIWHQANYDALTGLPNRNLFKDRLDQAMHAAQRESERLALLYIDLDRFKWVNDTLGHASGDLLLQEAGRRLRHSVRETDTVARLGGDEFIVLLNEIKGTADVDRIATLLLHRLSEPFELDGREAFVSASIGITLYPGDAGEMEQLLGNADAAMYIAKEHGRNGFHYFTQEMNDAAQRRLKLEADLRRALEREELTLAYQPILTVDGEVVGAEALLRWNHPELGAISPDEFIPLAEEIGLIVEIERWVMRKACTETVSLQQRSGKPLSIAVNISSVQCKSDQCQKVLGSVLEDTGLDPTCLKLEITERVMMQNTEQVVAMLSDLRSMGVRLAVDDFGTGYSSLSYLKQFPVDLLKIDRTFVHGLPTDRDDVALVEAIIVMGHSLNLAVVAEGVEQSEQLTFLASLGCDMVQGFYFSKPLSYDDYAAYLENC